MSISNPAQASNLETYFRDLLSPTSAKDIKDELPSLSKYAILLEGEHINIALLLDDFAGVSHLNKRCNYAILSADDLANPTPQPLSDVDSLVVKIRDLPIGLACKRVETIIDLNEAKFAFHFDESKPWSAGMIQGHWAMLLDVSKLLDISAKNISR